MSNMNTCSLECQVRYQEDDENTNVHQLNSSSKFTGGVTSTLILHPLDLIKIRFAGELKSRMFFKSLLKVRMTLRMIKSRQKRRNRKPTAVLLV